MKVHYYQIDFIIEIITQEIKSIEIVLLNI